VIESCSTVAIETQTKYGTWASENELRPLFIVGSDPGLSFQRLCAKGDGLP